MKSLRAMPLVMFCLGLVCFSGPLGCGEDEENGEIVIVEKYCNDGLDGDRDGCIDWADSDCGGVELNCEDGRDDDCDGLVDYHDTLDCIVGACFLALML